MVVQTKCVFTLPLIQAENFIITTQMNINSLPVQCT